MVNLLIHFTFSVFFSPSPTKTKNDPLVVRFWTLNSVILFTTYYIKQNLLLLRQNNGTNSFYFVIPTLTFKCSARPFMSLIV